MKLTPAELQSNFDRQKWAELLIELLPVTHDGRNSWLLNYGERAEAEGLRRRRGITFNPEYRAVVLQK